MFVLWCAHCTMTKQHQFINWLHTRWIFWNKISSTIWRMRDSEMNTFSEIEIVRSKWMSWGMMSSWRIFDSASKVSKTLQQSYMTNWGKSVITHQPSFLPCFLPSLPCLSSVISWFFPQHSCGQHIICFLFPMAKPWSTHCLFPVSFSSSFSYH